MCCFPEVVMKYVLIISNIIFALLGIAIIGLGSATQVQLNQLVDVFVINFRFLSISLIIIGCIIFVISFCACWGAIKESLCLLITYAVFMGILAAVKVFLIVVIFIFLATVWHTVSTWLNSAFNSLRPAGAAQFNAMETVLQCCGTTGATSYYNAGRSIPPTCCYNPDMLEAQCTLANSYEGCNTKLAYSIDSFGDAIAGVLIVLVIVEIVCMVFGLILVFRIRNKRFNR